MLRSTGPHCGQPISLNAPGQYPFPSHPIPGVGAFDPVHFIQVLNDLNCPGYFRLQFNACGKGYATEMCANWTLEGGQGDDQSVKAKD